MGYVCPVCDDPQADGIHLAHHVAFTAITSGGEHDDWLSETVPDWGELGPAALAETLTEEAEETEYPQVFETEGAENGHPHGRAQASKRNHQEPGAIDSETRAILEEAMQMTHERRAGEKARASADAEAVQSADSETE